MYQTSRESGSVYLNMKRYCGRLATMRRHKPALQAEAAASEEPRCIVRARTNDKKTKCATVVYNKDIVRFQLALGNILRLHLDGLKERKKTAEEKKREKEQKKKEKAAEKKGEKRDSTEGEKATKASEAEKPAAKKKGR